MMKCTRLLFALAWLLPAVLNLSADENSDNNDQWVRTEQDYYEPTFEVTNGCTAPPDIVSLSVTGHISVATRIHQGDGVPKSVESR